MNDSELMFSNKEDQKFYLKAVEGLPLINGYSMNGLDSEGVPMCYGVGPHSVRCMREVVEIVNPKRIFEIGTNVSYSAALWLELALDASIWTCDISKRKETEDAATIMRKRYPKRYHYMNRNEGTIFARAFLMEEFYDMSFIDGDHTYEGITKDIALCTELGIPWIVFDDWLPQFSETQKCVVEWPQLEQVKVMGNIALYKNTTI